MKFIKPILIVAALLCTQIMYAQALYFTRNGKVSFFSKTSMENIDAVNNEVFSAIDTQKGEMAFAVLVKGFKFEKALMEEHFNENYMESDKFPKATFNGKIVNASTVSFKKHGTYPVQVEGELTIHGVIVAAAGVSSSSNFSVKLKDYNIAVPNLVAGKIAESIDITVDCAYTLKENK